MELPNPHHFQKVPNRLTGQTGQLEMSAPHNKCAAFRYTDKKYVICGMGLVSSIHLVCGSKAKINVMSVFLNASTNILDTSSIGKTLSW